MSGPVGVDLGGVVIDSSGPDTFFGPDYLKVPAVAGALDAIAQLHAARGVYIVSKCGPKIEEQSRQWLDAQHFTDHTGVHEYDWYFVRERPDKALIAYTLGLAAMVDDRQDVLAHMGPGIQRVHFGQPPTATWPDVLALLLSTPAEPAQPSATDPDFAICPTHGWVKVDHKMRVDLCSKCRLVLRYTNEQVVLTMDLDRG